MEKINTVLIKFLEDQFPEIVKNSEFLFGLFFFILISFLAALWLYCGVFMFLDYRKRDHRSIISIALLLLGIFLGPLAVVFYLVARPKETLEDRFFLNLEHRFYYHQASKVLVCLKCGAYVGEFHQYCTNCGTQNRFKCEKCGTLTDYDDNFCPNCGHYFGSRYEKIVADIKNKQIEEKKAKESIKCLQMFRMPQMFPKVDMSSHIVKIKILAKKVKANSKSYLNYLENFLKTSKEKLRSIFLIFRRKISKDKNNE